MAVKSNNRYFRITYYCMTVNHQDGWGSIGAIVPDGKFVNEVSVRAQVFSVQADRFPYNPMADVVIQHVQEMSEQDYFEFYNKTPDKGALNITFSQN